MTDRDLKDFGVSLMALGEIFNESISTLRVDLYFQALRGFSISDVQRVSQEIAITERFFPKPVDFIERLRGSSDDQSELAWTGLLREIRQTGYTGKPTLPDATWNAVLEIWGSWVNLCQTLPGEGPELLGWAKRFKSAYVAVQKAATRPALPFDKNPEQLSGDVQ